MKMLSRVECIPLECLQEGVPWNWKSTSEYFDSMKGDLSINAGFSDPILPSLNNFIN